MDRSTIEAYAALAAAPSRWIAGLTRDQLLAHPVPNTWSIQHLVLHMLDSDLVASDRMKRVIAEDKPLLVGYDETKFSQRLGYDRLDAARAAEMFRLNREHTAQMLRALPDDAFARQGVHTERGLIALSEFVSLYVWHVEHHAKFAEAKRAALGKPLQA